MSGFYWAARFSAACPLGARGAFCTTGLGVGSLLRKPEARRMLSVSAGGTGGGGWRGEGIPVIDIGPFLRPPRVADGTDLAAAKRATARELEIACSECGFFYVKNHGADRDVCSQVHDMARAFFSLPEAVKMKAGISAESDVGRGYQPVGKNVTQGKPDMHEALDLMVEKGRGEVEDGSLGPILDRHPELAPLVLGRNRWPEEGDVRGFKECFERYSNEMLTLGESVMRGMAASLGLEEDFFARGLTNESFWVMRVIGYPPVDSGGGGIGCGTHTDYGCLTIVNQDALHTSLQVVDRRTGEWMSAPPIEGAFVMNIGDMFDVWTMGKYKSTPHRVIHASSTYRVSIPFFYEPNADAEVKFLLGGDGDGRSVRYIDHLHAKVSTNFDHADRYQ